MSDIHARTHEHGAEAKAWLTRMIPGWGIFSTFSVDLVLAAFEAGYGLSYDHAATVHYAEQLKWHEKSLISERRLHDAADGFNSNVVSFTGQQPAARVPVSNVRDVIGALSDPSVVGAVISAIDRLDCTPKGEAPFRVEGVADLTAFRLTTGDPRFDPAEPVVVNGYLYHPTKEV